MKSNIITSFLRLNEDHTVVKITWQKLPDGQKQCLTENVMPNYNQRIALLESKYNEISL